MSESFVEGLLQGWTIMFFLLLMLLCRSLCHQVSNQADKLDLLAIFYY